MRNDLNVKGTWYVNENNQNEIYLDYFNKEGNFVGNIIVGEIGTLEWNIMDGNYQDDLFPIIEYINNKVRNLRLTYQEKDLDPERWNRMKTVIKYKSIILNRNTSNRYSTGVENNIKR